MAWSEEARQASIEARRASAAARKGSSIKEKGKEEAHRKAAEAHRTAAMQHRREGNDDAIEHHEKMAAEHDSRAERAAFHQGGGANAISKTESGLSNKQTAKNASDHAEAMTKQARNDGSKQSHQDAMEAHSHAAKMQRAAGNVKAAKMHEEQAKVHNEIRRTDRVVESAQKSPGVRNYQDQNSEKSKSEPEKFHYKSVDDYEHSGDTENQIRELQEHGAKNVQVHFEGRDEDGDLGATVKYQLPKGVSKAQFDKVHALSYEAQDHVTGTSASQKDPVVSKLRQEMSTHYDAAKTAIKMGQGEKAVEHADKMMAAQGKLRDIAYSPAASAASKEAKSQSTRANRVGTPEAHSQAAIAHGNAYQQHQNAGHEAESKMHLALAQKHRNLSHQSAMQQYANKMK